MEQKVFLEKNRISLKGDYRDIMLPASLTPKILRWTKKMKIDTEFPLGNEYRKVVREYMSVDLWRIRDEQQRMLFILKWT